MEIQVITYDKSKYKSMIGEILNVNNFNEAMSFDNYKYNIIDLTNSELWKFHDIGCSNFTNINLINHLKNMIKSTANIVLIILPNNINVKCDYKWINGVSDFQSSRKLKDILPKFRDVLVENINEELINIKLIFEKNCSKLNNKDNFESDFYFDVLDDTKIYITTENKNKAVILKLGEKGNIYISTLHSLLNDKIINNVIDGVFTSKQIEVPEWVNNVSFYTDEELNQNNLQLESELDEINSKIEKNNEKLNENKEYKKILYTSGDVLVRKVTDILEKILIYDCSDFIDENKEDMRIKFDDITFIFEIKGENDGINKKNISQLMTHVDEYEDSLEKEGEPSEIIKGILIKNEFKNKPINEREPVHVEVIERAVKNNCLIITSKLLLDLFEKYLRQEMTVEQAKEILKNQTGLINLNSL